MTQLLRRSLFGAIAGSYSCTSAQNKPVSHNKYYDRLKALSVELNSDGHINISKAVLALANTFRYSESTVKVNQTITAKSTSYSIYVRLPSVDV